MRRARVIVGGGVAGAAAACLLARAGRSVTLIERESVARHKVCGEFLSGAAQNYLQMLGLDLMALGAVPIDHVRLAAGSRMVSAELPFRGLSLPRDTLDEALLRRAMALGAEVIRGRCVREVAAGHPLRILTSDAGLVVADTLFLASGKHDLRGAERAASHAGHDLVGLKTYLRLASAQTQALSGHIELAMFDGGYAGLQLVGEGRANLSLLVSRGRFAKSGKDWPRLIGELCAENALLHCRLRGAEPELERPLAIFRLPFGFRHRDAAGNDNIYRLGDQMACTPSFSGDGMSIALHTATQAVEAYLAGDTAKQYHRRMRGALAGQFACGRILSGMIRVPFGRHLLMTAAGMSPLLLPGLARLTRLQPPKAPIRSEIVQ
ncbi:NAD(P)/FAD-dependent oxidoreductase [Dongia sp.]|uniref:NAD(P)/FAD-dependent oxidoreductase n=1 Tax=Dongia sp. TaxID=1977262 RepID=UPI0035B017E4